MQDAERHESHLGLGGKDSRTGQTAPKVRKTPAVRFALWLLLAMVVAFVVWQLWPQPY